MSTLEETWIQKENRYKTVINNRDEQLLMKETVIQDQIKMISTLGKSKHLEEQQLAIEKVFQETEDQSSSDDSSSGEDQSNSDDSSSGEKQSDSDDSSSGESQSNSDDSSSGETSSDDSS